MQAPQNLRPTAGQRQNMQNLQNNEQLIAFEPPPQHQQNVQEVAGQLPLQPRGNMQIFQDDGQQLRAPQYPRNMMQIVPQQNQARPMQIQDVRQNNHQAGGQQQQPLHHPMNLEGYQGRFVAPAQPLIRGQPMFQYHDVMQAEAQAQAAQLHPPEYAVVGYGLGFNQPGLNNQHQYAQGLMNLADEVNDWQPVGQQLPALTQYFPRIPRYRQRYDPVTLPTTLYEAHELLRKKQNVSFTEYY